MNSADSLQMIADSIRRVEVADSLHRIYVADSTAAAQLELKQRVFGESSQLCEQLSLPVSSHEGGIDFLVSDPIYVSLSIAFALLYFVWLPHIVRGGSVKWSLLKRMNRRDSDDNREVVGHQQMSMKVATWVLGLSMISMLSLRVISQYIDLSGRVNLGVWIAGGVIMVVLLLLYGWGVVALAGYLALKKEFVDRLLDMKRQLYVFFVILASPLFIVSGIANYEQGEWMLQLSAFVAFAFIVVFIRQSFLFFMRQNISILHWILYLCAVEILPLTFLWGVASRMMAS